MSALDFPDGVIHRLRELHRVYEQALILAGDALNEAHPQLSSREWFETLLKKAVRDMEEAQVFGGRWSLFTSAELCALRVPEDSLWALPSLAAELQSVLDMRADEIARLESERSADEAADGGEAARDPGESGAGDGQHRVQDDVGRRDD